MDSGHGSPSWRPGIGERGQLSPSYRSSAYTRMEPDRSRQVFARDVPLSGGDVRSFCASDLVNPEGSEYRQDLYFSGLDRINNPVHPERSLFGLMGSVPGGERRNVAMPGFSGEKSASMRKFQWDNLFVDDKPGGNYGYSSRGLSDSGGVPVSMSENSGGGSLITGFDQRMENSESGRNYGAMDGRYAYSYSSPNPVGVIGRSSIVDSVVNRIERDKKIDIDMLTDNENAYRNNENAYRNGMVNNRRRMLLENDTYENEKHVDRRSFNMTSENQKFIEDFSFTRNELNDHGSSVHEDVVERMPMLCDEFDDSSGYSYEQLLQLQEAIDLRLAQNHLGNNQKIPSPYSVEDACDSTSGGDRDWTYEEIEQLAMLENSGRGMYQGQSRGTSAIDTMYQGRSRGSSGIDAMSIQGNSFSSADEVSISRRTSKSSKRDVRQRLGPALSVKQRLEYPQQVGKRQIASKHKKKNPWLKHDREKPMEDQKIIVQEVKIQEEKPKEHADTESKEYAKTEPREDSEEFKNQVQRAFLKMFKFLNENSADLRRYLEQGGARKLRCCICGSSSKAFADTIGLAQHAFFSCKSRSEHLGLYKAICVLMGWDSTIVVKGKWIQQILPSAEASSLREDLIIWPPVVLIHHSSLSNDGKDNLMTVSIEGLKHILRGMGCDPRMTNICHGKAANQSTMVVSFSGTFSGLQEAEKLHKLFSKKQQGRPEFQQICSRDNKMNHQETPNVSSDNKTNHQETRNVSSDYKMKHQETLKVSDDNMTNHVETRKISNDTKVESPTVSDDNMTDPQETQNVSSDNKMNHQETPNVSDDNMTVRQETLSVSSNNKMETQTVSDDIMMDRQETRNVFDDNMTDHQETQIVSSDHKKETQIVSDDNMTDNQETRNVSSNNKMETQTVSDDNMTDHQKTQTVPSDNKMDHQETRKVSDDNMTNHQVSRNVCNDNKMKHQNVLVCNIESFLYGYMGIASDLDELDPETKRRSVVRSKKEMEAIANASLKSQ
ncbi:hypothetical protein M5689_022601 [Euphorbia peplus]|nr:hypothetical protein M5689_022601 [Euphorbia peplus]